MGDRREGVFFFVECVWRCDVMGMFCRGRREGKGSSEGEKIRTMHNSNYVMR